MEKDNKDKLKKKFTHARPEFRKDMTLEEEAEIINPESVKTGSGIWKNGCKNLLLGRLNQNPGPASWTILQEITANYMN